MPQPGFFDIDRRLDSISRMGDPLERLAAEIPWELFRPLLEKMREKERKSAAGRKPLDAVLMFKVLIEVPSVFRLPRAGVHATCFSPSRVLIQSFRNSAGEV
jgi:hypothetical protein